MNTIERTALFDGWLAGLKDRVAKMMIARRIDRAANGNFGDVKSVGEGVSELRIDHGPGYRVYFMRTGSTVYLLLCGGDKSSQSHDIAQAISMAKQLRGELL